jgi:hypothetical protein
MSLSALNGGLWGYLIAIYWISHYLQRLIYVWNKNNNYKMVKVWDKINGNTLHIVYGKNHFEPTNNVIKQ